MDASKPVAVLFGKVTSISPLKVNIEQKMTLGAEQLILSRNVTDYTVNVTVNWGTNSRLGSISTENGSYNLSHSHTISGSKSMTVHNALAVGDEVILLRVTGGQKFVILDRVIA